MTYVCFLQSLWAQTVGRTVINLRPAAHFTVTHMSGVFYDVESVSFNYQTRKRCFPDERT
jgi:hypothetical protein